MRYGEIIKVKIIVTKKDIPQIVGALFDQSNSLFSHISIGSVHHLDKLVAQIVF